MTIRWQFVEQYEGDSSSWSWRTVNVDGTLEHHSPPFSTYGLAVSDAIKKGFQPRQHHWLVTTRHTITHFSPGKPPLTVPVSGPAENTRRAIALGSKGRSASEARKDPQSPSPLVPRRRETQ